jgi:hypothetical protein
MFISLLERLPTWVSKTKRMKSTPTFGSLNQGKIRPTPLYQFG